jgi:hypothetical protein
MTEVYLSKNGQQIKVGDKVKNKLGEIRTVDEVKNDKVYVKEHIGYYEPKDLIIYERN